jgi:hypothetical protein
MVDAALDLHSGSCVPNGYCTCADLIAQAGQIRTVAMAEYIQRYGHRFFAWSVS